MQYVMTRTVEYTNPDQTVTTYVAGDTYTLPEDLADQLLLESPPGVMCVAPTPEEVDPPADNYQVFDQTNFATVVLGLYPGEFTLTDLEGD